MVWKSGITSKSIEHIYKIPQNLQFKNLLLPHLYLLSPSFVSWGNKNYTINEFFESVQRYDNRTVTAFFTEQSQSHLWNQFLIIGNKNQDEKYVLKDDAGFHWELGC